MKEFPLSSTGVLFPLPVSYSLYRGEINILIFARARFRI